MEDKIKAVPCDEIKLDPVVVVRGRDGKDGIDGRDGKDGIDGRDGLDGKDGLNGKDGKDGKDAVAGPGICLVPDYNEKTGELTFKEGNPKDVVKKKFKLKREETYIKRGGMTVVNNVSDVQINSESIVSSGIANIPAATIGGGYGVVKIAPAASAFGLSVHASGALFVSGATNTQITNKQGINNALLPGSIDLITKVGLTTNTITLTDAEKTSAQSWLGINKPAVISVEEALSTYTIPLTLAPLVFDLSTLTSDTLDLTFDVSTLTGAYCYRGNEIKFTKTSTNSLTITNNTGIIINEDIDADTEEAGEYSIYLESRYNVEDDSRDLLLNVVRVR